MRRITDSSNKKRSENPSPSPASPVTRQCPTASPLTKLAALLAITALSQAADLHVDHATVAGRDLKFMRAQFAAVGIRTEYGGKHTNGLTEMAIASFADGSYLELIAAQDPQKGAPSHYWGKFIDENAGPCAWAIGAADLDSEATRLHTTIKESGRTRSDGVQLQWRSATIGPETQGTFLPFMIHDQTKRALRAYPGGKPTMPEWQGVARVYIAVRNLDAAIKRYREAFQLPAPVKLFDKSLNAESAHFENTPVTLVTSRTGWLAARLSQFGESPCAFVIATSQNSHGDIRWLPIKGMKIGILP